MARLDQPITFLRAVREIGWSADRNGSLKPAARRLLRLVLLKEQQIGKEFAVRDRSGRPWQVTLGALTRYLPELRPSHIDTMGASLRALQLQFEGRMEEIADERIDIRVEPELQTLHNRDEQMASEVESLIGVISKLAPDYQRPPKIVRRRARTEPR